MSLIKSLFAGLVIVLVASGEISSLTCLARSTPDPISIQELQSTGTITFIPIDDFPRSTLEALSRFFRTTYGLNIAIASPLFLPPRAYNVNREQFIAEEIVDELKKHYSWTSSEEPFIRIAFTKRDMYIEKYNWRYALGFLRGWRAVVSTTRMDYGFLSLWTADQETQKARLRKMITKYIGASYFRLPFSKHCRSAMYGNIGGPRDLDAMSDYL